MRLQLHPGAPRRCRHRTDSSGDETPGANFGPDRARMCVASTSAAGLPFQWWLAASASAEGCPGGRCAARRRRRGCAKLPQPGCTSSRGHLGSQAHWNSKQSRRGSRQRAAAQVPRVRAATLVRRPPLEDAGIAVDGSVHIEPSPTTHVIPTVVDAAHEGGYWNTLQLELHMFPRRNVRCIANVSARALP